MVERAGDFRQFEPGETRLLPRLRHTLSYRLIDGGFVSLAIHSLDDRPRSPPR